MAVLGVQVKIGRPCGIVLLVYFDDALFGENPARGGFLVHKPGILPLDGLVFTKNGPVDHYRELVADGTFLGASLYQKVAVAVLDEGNLDVLARKFDSVAGFVSDAVLDVAAAFCFPAVVDAATGE